MKNFLLGILFVFLGIPILQAIANSIEDNSQLLSCKTAKKIYNIKKQIQQQSSQEETSNSQIGFQTQCIGYEVNNENQFEEDEDE